MCRTFYFDDVLAVRDFWSVKRIQLISNLYSSCADGVLEERYLKYSARALRTSDTLYLATKCIYCIERRRRYRITN